ncbi:MAG: aldo/keto reductase, partial [Saprospiraceae bacterium]|nr:aldo/keto reductase [Saprospiraceae bacterium]
MTHQVYFDLTPTTRIPGVGFGTYLIDNETVGDAVSTAIRSGYRHIDTAEGYRNEQGVGQGIRNAMSELGLQRSDIFVTTKLWPGNAAWGHPVKDAAATIRSLDESLERLQMDYVDLYLIHAPYGDRIEAWKGLVELRQQGKARAIGVSNFSQAHIEELTVAGLPLPDANQIELHPWSQKPDLVSFLKDHGVSIIAYSSLVPLSTWRTAEGHGSAKTDKMKADGAADTSPFKVM